MPFGIVAYALMLFSWTTFVETAVYSGQTFPPQQLHTKARPLVPLYRVNSHHSAAETQQVELSS